MSKQLSLPEMLAELEDRVAFHQAEAHARQEALHHEERARHASALEQAEQQLAALRAAAAGAEAFLRDVSSMPVAAAAPEPANDGPRLVSRMVAAVVRDWPAGSSFGASAVAAEVDRRFAGTLGKPVSVPTVARTLLRLSKSGALRTVRAGVSHA